MDLGEGIRRALSKITGAALVDEKAIKELVKELQRVLISNDVNVKLVFELCKRIEERALKDKKQETFNLREHVVKIVYDELVAIIGDKYEPQTKKQKILMIGLFGSGKTTSIAKLAKFYQSKGLKACVIAGDIHRPAAVEQLKQLSEQVHCGFFHEKGKSADEIARDSLKQQSIYDVLIFDSAGRSAFDGELATELKKINSVFQPDEKYLVVSADLGQVAGKQAKQFHDAVGITGVIVTKMDGSGKGGGALSAVKASESRVAFLTFGEKPDALEIFDSKKFVARLVGYPDLQSLLEKVREVSDEEALQKSMEEGKLDYETFLAQMRSMRKMGPMKQVFQMIGMYDIPQEMLGKSEEKLKQFEAAVLSMTAKERKEPDLMKNKARQERIAKGSGLKPEAVRELVSSFEGMRKAMKGLKGNRGMMKKLQKMMPGFKGF